MHFLFFKKLRLHLIGCCVRFLKTDSSSVHWQIKFSWFKSFFQKFCCFFFLRSLHFILLLCFIHFTYFGCFTCIIIVVVFLLTDSQVFRVLFIYSLCCFFFVVVVEINNKFYLFICLIKKTLLALLFTLFRFVCLNDTPQLFYKWEKHKQNRITQGRSQTRSLEKIVRKYPLSSVTSVRCNRDLSLN